MLPVGRKESLLNMAFSLSHLSLKGYSSVLTKYSHFKVVVKGILWLTRLNPSQTDHSHKGRRIKKGGAHSLLPFIAANGNLQVIFRAGESLISISI